MMMTESASKFAFYFALCCCFLAPLGLSRVLFVSDVETNLFRQSTSVAELATDALDEIAPHSVGCLWVVLMYDPTCGHCRQYAPEYELLAKNTKENNEAVVFTAINCVAHEDICRRRNASDFPQLYIVEGEKNVWRSISTDNPQAIHSFPRKDHGHCHAVQDYVLEQQGLVVRSHKAKSALSFHEEKKIHRRDVTNALFFTLWHEVPLAVRTPERYQALLRFLMVVDRALPDSNARKVLKGLQTEQNFLTTREWKRLVLDAGIPIRGTADSLQWKTCQGSTPYHRGFTCGLWLLYHTILVTTPNAEANAALHAIYDYVVSFFLCAHCRTDFTRSEPPFDASDPDGSKAILWLWKRHNGVTLRLSSESGQDPQVPKVQFPQQQDCPHCYKTGSSTDFNESEVVQYLRDHYKWHSIFHVLAANDHFRTDNLSAAELWNAEELVFLVALVGIIAIYLSWKSVQGKVPVRQRESYKKQKEDLLRQLKVL